MKRVALYPPEEFSSESRLGQVLKRLRWPIVEDRDQPELKIWLSDKPCPRRMLNGIPLPRDKWLLGVAHLEAFDYPINVEPENYVGMAVRKLANHGAHGVPVKCPTKATRGYVYQKLITNHPGDSRVEEWRVSIYASGAGNQDAIVSRKWLLKDDYGFSRAYRTPGTFTFDIPIPFDYNELHCLKRLAKSTGIDQGDIDVIRDLDGKLYVVDATVNTSVPDMELYNNCTLDSYIARHAEVFKEVFG